MKTRVEFYYLENNILTFDFMDHLPRIGELVNSLDLEKKLIVTEIEYVFYTDNDLLTHINITLEEI